MKARKTNKHKKKVVAEKSRKILRKEKRQKKKINRAQYYASKNDTPGKFVLNRDNSNPKKDSPKKLIDHESKLKIKLEQKKEREKRLEIQREKHRKAQLAEDNEKEDRVIKQLEKQLKLNKRKSKSTPKSFAADGLDYLLDFCNDENRKLAVETEKQLLGVDVESDFEDDFAMMTKTEEHDYNEDSKVSDTMDDSDENSEEVESQNDESENEKDNFSDDESNNDEFNEEIATADEESDNQSNCNEMENENSSNEIREDIYGKKRDKDGNVIDKYVPPAARLKELNKTSEEIAKLSRLRKQLKGLINRLAQHNMHNIAMQIDELFMSNSRNNMNEMLSKLMMESIVAPVITPDRLIADHMMLITILHANVGTEVGANFLLSLVNKFDEMMNKYQDVENKELDNLILMISHLYNFKVYNSQLVYQILDKLLMKFTEKEIELILLILKTVGFRLRKDDPIALKELILNIQQKATTSTSSNTRIQFMLDILLAIKNNNMNKIPNYDPTYIEHLKKLLKSFIRKGNSVIQLNISLNDLLKADERGKWWIVGSAWSGNIDNQSKINQTTNITKPQYSQKILDLARKQRMNTDIRRNIFCILLTAEDYLDAFEKIHHLGLKDQQAREIIYVMIDCCVQEKKFNPYYAVLAQKFCEYDRKNQMTLQYTLWDKLKTLADYSNIQLHNLAKFFTHLFIEKGLPLSVLKVVQFGELDKPTMRLIRQIMLGILLHDNTEACLQVFERISLSTQLQTLRDGLRLFISHFLIKNADSKSLPENEVEKLRKRAELVDKILLSRASKIIF
ncbi:hypothetical protein PV325_013400 [Microctonus aethiopoides]|uniref:MI domain-containing protein n=1 Tax=Microctonus aethiopoides TaxID=144406 RepID=A0AA39FN91_9HYME|nr:hypothetical protein PV325_013400 [Microctonus aethiopoides]KAK0172551.1 hypothetical protein PV328_005857 [Microctonus aethiopoides]